MIYRNFFVVFLSVFMIVTLTNCCTTKNDLKESPGYSNIVKSPSPGNILIKCSIEDLSLKAGRSMCKIKILSVIKYGAGTRPIGTDAVYTVEFNNDNKDELESILLNKKSAVLLLSEGAKGRGMKNDSSYRIINILK